MEILTCMFVFQYCMSNLILCIPFRVHITPFIEQLVCNYLWRLWNAPDEWKTFSAYHWILLLYKRDRFRLLGRGWALGNFSQILAQFTIWTVPAYGRYWHSVFFDLPTQNATILYRSRMHCMHGKHYGNIIIPWGKLLPKQRLSRRILRQNVVVDVSIKSLAIMYSYQSIV